MGYGDFVLIFGGVPIVSGKEGDTEVFKNSQPVEYVH